MVKRSAEAEIDTGNIGRYTFDRSGADVKSNIALLLEKVTKLGFAKNIFFHAISRKEQSVSDNASMSISVVKGRGHIRHNNREIVTPNVDQNRTKDNITYVKQPLEEAYEQCFSDAIKEYNKNQNRADRRIDGAKGYMEKIRLSKNGENLFYENVVQVGNKQDMLVPENREKAIKILDEYAKNFQKNNPNLYVFNMVLHLDEATPHLHIDYIPLAHEYKKGLQVRNSLDKALKEQGMKGNPSKKENSTQAWQRCERRRIKNLMRENDIEQKKGKDIPSKHLSVGEYKKICEITENEANSLPKQIETAPYAFNKKRVSVDVADLEKLEKRAKLSTIHEEKTEQMAREMKAALSTVKSDREKHLAKMERAEQLAEKDRREAQKELEQASRERIKYVQLRGEQEQLNERYNALERVCSAQRMQISDLQEKLEAKETVIASLNAQIRDLKKSLQDKVNELTQSFTEQIESVKERLHSVAETTRNVVRSVSWMKEQTTEPEIEKVCDAVQRYGEGWLIQDGFEDMAKEVFEPDLSDGIKELMTPEYERIIFRRGDKGYGFYASKAEGGEYLGKKSDFETLLTTFPKAKFEDPHEYIPQLHSPSFQIGLRGE